MHLTLAFRIFSVFRQVIDVVRQYIENQIE